MNDVFMVGEAAEQLRVSRTSSHTSHPSGSSDVRPTWCALSSVVADVAFTVAVNGRAL
jgi:hypothetical protein